MKQIFLIVINIIALNYYSHADIRLPKLVADNMVLQREKPLQIWGWADINEKINIKFLEKSYSVIAAKDGKWILNLPKAQSGGPFEMILKGKNEIKLKNILIGDVWICGGQSNMEWTFNSIKNKYNEEISNSENTQIRLITIEKNLSITILDDVKTEGWKICNPVNVKNFSAVAYFFGKDIQEKTKVPIGLISTNWGGTPAESWISFEGLNDFKHYQDNLLKAKVFSQNFSLWKEKATKLDEDALADTTIALLQNFNDWKSLIAPEIWSKELENFDGVVWLKKEIIFPKEAEGKDVTLSLSTIDDKDITYFNGKKIGSTHGHDVVRKYIIPGNLVKAGRNVISIRVTDFWGGGGLTGKSESIFLEFNASNLSPLGNWKYVLPLQGEWKYLISKKFSALVDKPLLKENTDAISQNSPSVLYNSMIAPLMPYSIKGVIWYQGESNALKAFEYQRLLPSLIKDWRKNWRCGDFPLLITQLSNWKATNELPMESDWAELREAQLMALSVINTGLAVTIDIGQADDIHPWNKQDVGKRLALAALKVAYGLDIVYSGPIYESMKIDGNKIRLKFKNIGYGLISKNGELKEFSIAGEDHKFIWARAIIEDANTIVVWADEIKTPLAVRYAWADNPSKTNLYNKEGLPASPFRTDKWKGITESQK